MQLLVGPYALSGMNRTVSGRAGMGLLLTRLVVTAPGRLCFPKAAMICVASSTDGGRLPIHDPR